MVEDAQDYLVNVVLAVVSGALYYGVHEVWHMQFGHGDVAMHAGSVAFGVVSALGYYLMTLKNEVELEPVIGALAFVLAAAAHSGHYLFGVEAIGMGVLMAAVGVLGALITGFLPELDV